MPGDERRVRFLLNEEIRRPAQQVRTVKIFDRIENPWMADEIGESSKQEVRLVPQVAAKRPTCLTLEAFKPVAIAECLGV